MFVAMHVTQFCQIFDFYQSVLIIIIITIIIIIIIIVTKLN